MLKVSCFRGESSYGPAVIPLFGPAEETFEKTAAATLLPDVVRYVSTLRPRPDAQYVLVNAMGAGEYYGSNINGDYFSESSLIHAPDDWTGNPVYDRVRARDWGYGFPTFYGAHPYAHHRNKDVTRAFGEVELSVWNPLMKRVELIVRVDKILCEKFGGVGVWDKLKMGEFPDVSMGCKVPYDTCSICLDWDTYRKAQATFDSKKYRTPGDAVLAFHKKSIADGGRGIRGLSITRADYCEHAKKSMNRILPDGRKVFVYNDYPRFFDISFVFVGADKTAKVMMKIASEGQSYWFLSGAELAEKLGYDAVDETLGDSFAGTLKVASVDESSLKIAFLGKQAKNKNGEITKDIVPSQFAGKAVPVLTKHEPSVSNELLDVLATRPLEEALSTPAGLGLVLKPHEFQRIILIRIGKRDLADELDDKGLIFPKTDRVEDVPMDSSFFHPALARMLLSLLSERSGLGPYIEKRVVMVGGRKSKEDKGRSSLSTSLQHKLGAAYNGYRNGVMNVVAGAQNMIASAATSSDVSLNKIASAPVDVVFTPLSAAYFKFAFLDEVGGACQEKNSQAQAGVERVLPSRNT